MGRVEIDFDAFLDPLRWMSRTANGRGFVTKGVLLLGGIGYLFSLTIFFIAILPLLWLYEKIV